MGTSKRNRWLESSPRQTRTHFFVEHKIAGFRKRTLPSGMKRADPLQWINSQELVFALRDWSGEKQHTAIYRLDGRIGVKQPLPTLNARLDGADFYQIRFSRNGKWLIWTDYSGIGDVGKIYVGRVDGSQPIQGPFPASVYATFFQWMDDGYRWMELITNRDAGLGGDSINYTKVSLNRIVLHDVRNSKHIQILTPSTNSPMRAHGLNVAHITVVSHDCVLADNFRWDTEPSPFPTSIVQIVKTGLEENVRVRRFAVHPPSNSLLRQMIYSPDGSSIAWEVVTRHNTSPMLTQLHRLLKMKLPPQHRLELWISHLDGTGMHEVGYIATDEWHFRFLDPKWLPDGRRLSFTYQDALYTVPAD